MKINGSDILRAAYEVVTSQQGLASDEELDAIARRSRFVIDSQNLSAVTLGERTGAHVVTLAPGASSFTWGQGGDIDELPPSRVSYWALVEGGYERQVTPNGRLTPLDEWLNRSYLGPTGEPRLLYWQRDLVEPLEEDGEVDGQTQVFRVAPAADTTYTLCVYATVPALSSIERGKTYYLPQGVANFLVRLLAVDTEERMGFPPRPELRSALSTAKQNLQKVPRTARARAVSPDWLDLDGRGDNYVGTVY